MILKISALLVSAAAGFGLGVLAIPVQEASTPLYGGAESTLLVNIDLTSLPAGRSVESFGIAAINADGRRIERSGLADPVAMMNVPSGRWRIHTKVFAPGGDVIGFGATTAMVGVLSVTLRAERVRVAADECNFYMDRDGFLNYVADPATGFCEPLASDP